MTEESLAKAWQLLSDGDNDAARAKFAEAVAADPENTDALIGMGKALARLGRVNDALQAFEAALQLNPDIPEAHFGAGWAHFQRKEWREAEAHDRRAVNMAPDVAKYHYAVAACAMRRKDMETALLHLEAANYLDPALFDGRARWILAYYRIFAGVEKLGLLVSWATLATMYACTLSAANLWWWFLGASLPFLAVSGWNFRKGRRRRAIWALVLCVLWAVPAYLLVEWLLSR